MKTYLQHQTGDKYSLKLQLSKGLGGVIARQLIQQYLDILEDANLLHTLPITNRNKKKLQFAVEVFLFNAWLALEENKQHSNISVVVNYSRDKKQYSNLLRYFKHIGYKTLIKIIDISLDLGFITGQKGYVGVKESKRSYFQPTKKLEYFIQTNINTARLETYETEPIQLKNTKKQLIQYRDNNMTNILRDNINTINNNIVNSNITIPNYLFYLYDNIPSFLPFFLYFSSSIYHSTPLYGHLEIDPLNQVVGGNFDWFEISRHSIYHRVFNDDSFTIGGRFYSEIQSLPKSIRRHIRINGSQTTSYDYSGMHIRLLYHINGIEFNADPYYIKGWDRGIVKKCMLTILNSTNEKSAAKSISDNRYKEALMPYSSALKLIADIKQRHSKISNLICSGQGKSLQYRDSVLAEKIMIYFAVSGIVCLGIHDGFIVPVEYGDELKDIMTEIYQLEYNFTPVVKREY